MPSVSRYCFFVFLPFALFAISIPGCKTFDKDEGSKVDGASEASIHGDEDKSDHATDRNVSAPNEQTSHAISSVPQKSVVNEGAFFHLIGAPVTPDNDCETGDSACVQNGHGFACGTPNGDLGLCMNSRFLGCECRSLANSPLLQNNELPKVAADTTNAFSCSSSSYSAACSSQPLGSLCSTPKNGSGYCVARDFPSKSCICAPALPDKTYTLGAQCNAGTPATDACRGFREGTACLTSVGTTGVCLGTDNNGNNRCNCVTSTQKPVLPVVTCVDGSQTDAACRTMAPGVLCSKNGAEGICQVSSNGFSETGCTCMPSTYQFNAGVDSGAVCSSNSSQCASKTIGDPCSVTGSFSGGKCLVTDGRNDTCTCSITSLPSDPSPNPTHVYATRLTNNSMYLNWKSGGGSTAGFFVKSALGAAPATCATAVDMGTNLFVAFSGMQPATTYGVRVCSYNGDKVASPGVALTIATNPTLAPAKILLTDKFDRPSNTTIGSPWIEGVGDVKISGGALTNNTTGLGVLTAPGSVADVIVESDYDLLTSPSVSGVPLVGIFARHQGPGEKNTYMAQVTTDGSLPVIPALQIWKNVNGTWTQLGANANNIPYAGRLKLSIIGSTLVAYANNLQVLTVTDATFAAGGFGLRFNLDHGFLDNFSASTP